MIQLANGVYNSSYFISLLNLVLVYVSAQAAYTFFIECEDPERIFRKILYINFFLCIVALVLYASPISDWVWMQQNISKGLEHFRRMKLFTYEPSYYAMIWIPVFIFYLLQYLFRQNKVSSTGLLIMLFLPFVLSFSMGVIGAAILAGLLTHLLYFNNLTKKRRILNAMVYTGTVLGCGLIAAVLFFRHNPVFSRIANIFSGSDTSGNGRTLDAFILAQRILRQTNELWGVGLGQIKIVGATIIRSYYLYTPDFPVAIPNAAAETLVIFGWVGFCLRIGIEIFLFAYTRVWTNYYRLFLFLFMFIYQFTGSFITNIAEYVIWILAFTNVFRQFDVKIRPVATDRLALTTLQPAE